MKLNSNNLNITLRHLRALHAIWAQGSFTRAAAALGIVPSALTETIRQLEVEAGAPLFDRTTRPPAPTLLGLAFLRETAPLLAGLDDAVEKLCDQARLRTGQLAIGASPSAISRRVAPALARFRQLNPGIACQLHDDVAEALADMVSDGRLDLAIAGRAKSSPDLRQTKIERDRFGLVCAAGHKLAGRAQVRLQEIDPASLISLSAATGTQQLLLHCPQLPEAYRQTTLLAHSTIAQLCMIRAGVGVSLMPKNAASLFEDRSIRFVPIEDLELWRTLYLLEPALRLPSPAAAQFAALLLQDRSAADRQAPHP